ncbi:MAG: energy transducer TonB [Microscillaceae bacterium]|jgi:protein TonB|nr:energy transducer TonB [Microscillaceae bacterium]
MNARILKTFFGVSTLFALCCGCFNVVIAQTALTASVKVQPSVEDKTVYKMTEVPPKPSCGIMAYLEYTEENIDRPIEAKKQGVKGNVFVQFIVEKDGKISNIKVIKGLGSGCDEAVVQCLQKAPKWIPGMQNGKTVRVQKTLAIAVR